MENGKRDGSLFQKEAPVKQMSLTGVVVFTDFRVLSANHKEGLAVPSKHRECIILCTLR